MPRTRTPDGEVDLLLSTDVLSEGQNLQQAQAVISYDMPWNPQRVVQRNGRVIRLLSPHDAVFLTTMLPEPGDLEEMLRLETLVRTKIRAAGVFGMEVEVLDSDLEMLRRIDPEGGEPGDVEAVDPESAWAAAAASIVAEHNRRAARRCELVERLGLRPALGDDVPPEISEDNLGVVCSLVVSPAA